MKHLRFNMCFERAMTRSTWNAEVKILLTKGEGEGQQYIIPIRKRINVLHAGYMKRRRGTALQVHKRLKGCGRIFHAVLSQQACEKWLWQIGNNYLSGHTSTKYQQLSAPFPGLEGHPYLSLLYSNPQEKYPQFQQSEGITAFPYVVLCRRSHINLNPVSCSFIYS